MYEIERDIKNHRMVLTLIGPIDHDPDVFFRDFTASALAVRAANGEWDFLLDLSQTMVMEQWRAENTGKIFVWCCEHGMRALACVVESVTLQMQIQRVTYRNAKNAYFPTRFKAEAWLDEGQG